jgi:hypothetical protein
MNMLETLGTLVAIGAFVFWCDVTDSWKNVFLRNKLASWLRRASDPVRAGLSGLNERRAVEFEVILNKGKTSAENLKVQRRLPLGSR